MGIWNIFYLFQSFGLYSCSLSRRRTIVPTRLQMFLLLRSNHLNTDSSSFRHSLHKCTDTINGAPLDWSGQIKRSLVPRNPWSLDWNGFRVRRLFRVIVSIKTLQIHTCHLRDSIGVVTQATDGNEYQNNDYASTPPVKGLWESLSPRWRILGRLTCQNLSHDHIEMSTQSDLGKDRGDRRKVWSLPLRKGDHSRATTFRPGIVMNGWLHT